MAKNILTGFCFLVALTILLPGCKKTNSCETCGLTCSECPLDVGFILFDYDDETSDNIDDGYAASYSDDNYLQPGPCLAGTYDYAVECGEGDCYYSGYYTLSYPAFGSVVQYTLELDDDGAYLSSYYL